MRELLSKYIRGLAEREHSGTGPERYQDLGTFMCWLLDRHGYAIHRRTFHYEGIQRAKSAGRAEWGVDILASKADRDGVERVFLFVLKKGDFGRSEWVDGPGTMMQDLRLAAGRNVSELNNYARPGEEWKRITVVAAHNGDLDQEAIGAQVNNFLVGLTRDYRVETDWWNADAMVDLALAPPASGGASFQDRVDAALFPPSAQPFARMSLDSLARGRHGSRFDAQAVDLLLEQALPLGRVADADARVRTPALPEGTALDALRIRRSSREIALFAGMIVAESTRVADGSALPGLDAIERMLARVMEHIRRLPEEAWSGHKKAISDAVDDLLRLYLAQTLALGGRLGAVATFPGGLALPLPGESLSYPLRALRLGGYLAVGGLAALDFGDARSADALAALLLKLTRANPGAFLTPVTDDQIIELGAIWRLWLSLGKTEDVARTALDLIERLAVRRAIRQPLPSAFQRARVPEDSADIQALVETYLSGVASPGFSDGGSTILPLAVFLATKHGETVPDDWLFSESQEDPSQRRHRRRITAAQMWVPPVDAASEWYAREVSRGSTLGLDRVSADSGHAGAAQEMARAFASAATPFPRTPASVWGRPVIDWIAWKLWRTPPPMAVFIDAPVAAQNGSGDRSRPLAPMNGDAVAGASSAMRVGGAIP
jgi:hypothetical protein